MNLQDKNKQRAMDEVEAYSFDQMVDNVCKWAIARNITAEGGATSYSQLDKLREEVEEFANATTTQEAKLEFGDMLVCLINVARLRGLDMAECLELTYNKIKDRKGTMIGGKFVKET